MKINYLLYAGLLLSGLSAGCQKDSFSTFPIETNYAADEEMLKAKYINPIQNASIIELQVKPVQMDDIHIFNVSSG